MLSYVYIYVYEVEWLINDGRGPHFTGSCRFPRGGPTRGNPVMTTYTVTTSRKGDPQHMLREKEARAYEFTFLFIFRFWMDYLLREVVVIPWVDTRQNCGSMVRNVPLPAIPLMVTPLSTNRNSMSSTWMQIKSCRSRFS